MEKIANKKDDGHFAYVGMKYIASQLLKVDYNSEVIKYIVDTFLECVDTVPFAIWMLNGNVNGRPKVIFKEEINDLLQVSEDPRVIEDLFMSIYGEEVFYDAEERVFYATEWHTEYREKIDFTSITKAYERLSTLREFEIVSQSDIDNCITTVKKSGYDIEKDCEYQDNDVDVMASNIIKLLQEVFLL